jgi:hypothetical protein
VHNNTIPTCDKTKKISMIDKVQNERIQRKNVNQTQEINENGKTIGGLQNSCRLSSLVMKLKCFIRVQP